MPLLYEIPKALAENVATGKAELIGAIIKDAATGKILGHVQQSSVAQEVISTALGVAMKAGPFFPLEAVTAIQNVQIARNIAEIQNGVLLLQQMQVGAIALGGFGLGVAVVGFAVMHAKLNAIEKRLDATVRLLDEIDRKIGQVNEVRRNDDLRALFANVEADLQNLNILHNRQHPHRVAEQLQLSFTRATRQFERHFETIVDIASRVSAPLDLLDRLWTLTGAIRLCQDATIQALFITNELDAAQKYGEDEFDRQFKLLEKCVPDELSRLISRSEEQPEEAQELRRKALIQAHTLHDGIKGGIRTLAGQISFAQALVCENISGNEFLNKLRKTEEPFLFLEPANDPEPPFEPFVASGVRHRGTTQAASPLLTA